MYSGGSKMGHYHKIHIKFYIQLSMFPHKRRGGVGGGVAGNLSQRSWMVSRISIYDPI